MPYDQTKLNWWDIATEVNEMVYKVHYKVER